MHVSSWCCRLQLVADLSLLCPENQDYLREAGALPLLLGDVLGLVSTEEADVPLWIQAVSSVAEQNMASRQACIDLGVIETVLKVSQPQTGRHKPSTLLDVQWLRSSMRHVTKWATVAVVPAGLTRAHVCVSMCVSQLQAAYPESDMIRDGALALIAFVVANHRRSELCTACAGAGAVLVMFTATQHGLNRSPPRPSC